MSLPGSTKAFAPFEWMLALRYLRARRKQGFVSVISVLSFLGILLGVATLIVVMSVFNGFHQELLGKILGFTGHASVHRADRNPIENYADVAAKISAVKGVKAVLALDEGQVLATSQRGSAGALVRGVSGADLAKLPDVNNKDLQTAFAAPPSLDAKADLAGFDNSGSVIVGKGFAQNHQLVLGSHITLMSPNGPDTPIGNVPHSRDYAVLGIFSAGMSDYDDNVVYLPMADASDLLANGPGATSLQVMVDDPDRVQGQVAVMLAAAGPDMMVQSWQARNQAFFSALAVERNVVTMVLSLVVMVAALNIISGLYMMVKDKGSNIAILRTMGATSGSVLRVFFLVGAAIGTAGTFAGLIIGLIICWNAENIRRMIQWFSGVDPFNQELYYLAKLPAVVNYGQAVVVVLATLALSYLATLYPAWKAAKLDPVEALRYE